MMLDVVRTVFCTTLAWISFNCLGYLLSAYCHHEKDNSQVKESLHRPFNTLINSLNIDTTWLKLWLLD